MLLKIKATLTMTRLHNPLNHSTLDDITFSEHPENSTGSMKRTIQLVERRNSFEQENLNLSGATSLNFLNYLTRNKLSPDTMNVIQSDFSEKSLLDSTTTTTISFKFETENELFADNELKWFTSLHKELDFFYRCVSFWHPTLNEHWQFKGLLRKLSFFIFT